MVERKSPFEDENIDPYIVVCFTTRECECGFEASATTIAAVGMAIAEHWNAKVCGHQSIRKASTGGTESRIRRRKI